MIDPLTLSAGSAILGAGLNLYGANQQSNAMKAQIAANNKLRQQLRGDLKDVYGTAQSDVTSLYDPYTNLAQTGVNQMQQDYSVDPVNFQYNGQVSDFLDPNIDYAIDQGNRAIESGAAASGSLLSGAAQKALQKNAMDIGNQSWSDAYSRMKQDEADKYNQATNQYNQRVQQATQKYSQAGDITQLGMGAIGNQADAINRFATNYGSNLSGTAPQSAAGVGGQVWGQTMGNLGSGMINLSGNLGQSYLKNR